MPLGEPLADVRRIIVLRANALGDYLVAEPALRALRRRYPDARITLLGAPWQPGFLDRRPGPVDDVWVLPQVDGLGGQPQAPPADQLPEFRRRVVAERADLAVQLHGGGAVSNPLTRSFGARVAIGLRAPGTTTLDRWVAYRYYQHEVARYLEVVGLVGAEPCGAEGFEPRLALTEADHAEARAVLPPDDGDDRTPLVALHPGVSDPRRRWPTASFATLAEAVHAAGARVLLTGAPADAELTADIGARARVPVTDLTGRTGLGGLAAVYRRCAVVAGVDTGPLHLARAVGAATATVFWCGNAINAGPAGRGRHRVLLSWTLRCPECGAPCHHDLYPLRELGDGCGHTCSFVAEVPPEEMIDEVLDLLSLEVAQ
jgi:ADP-heptose:LPS heptosyltransferase